MTNGRSLFLVIEHTRMTVVSRLQNNVGSMSHGLNRSLESLELDYVGSADVCIYLTSVMSCYVVRAPSLQLYSLKLVSRFSSTCHSSGSGTG